MTIEEDTAPHPAPASTVPAVVLGGRYVLAERLGQGGMAEVFRARDSVLRRDVAVKVFHRNVEIPDAALRRSGEVTLLAGLSHPHLVMLFDAGRDDAGSYDYLVMELVRGTTLVPRVPLPGEVVAKLGAQLADALAYVHERGIVHRDVKPANVLLDAAGTDAKLTDFGVARLIEATALTTHGTTLGTPNYLSPEQATGDPLTGASDVYSLGLVLFEALTGTKAYPGTGIEAAVARLHRDPQLPQWVDARWRDLIAAMTARDPALRPSAAAVAAQLRGLPSPTAATQLVAPPAAGDTVALALPDTRSRRPWWLAAAFVAVIAVGALLVAMLGDGAAPSAPLKPPGASASAGAPAAAASRAEASRAAGARASASSRASASRVVAARASASEAAASRAARSSAALAAARSAASRSAASSSAALAAASRSRAVAPTPPAPQGPQGPPGQAKKSKPGKDKGPGKNKP